MEWLMGLFIFLCIIFLSFVVVGIYCCIRINYDEYDEDESEILSDLEKESVDKILSALHKENIKQRENE